MMPVAKHPALAERAQLPVRATVMVVDDDTDTRNALADILVSEGYEVILASNGLDALRAARLSPPPDLILTDLAMPVMDGWALCRELRADPRLAAIPVIVVSGDCDDPSLCGIKARAVFLKPVDLNTLLQRVEMEAG